MPTSSVTPSTKIILVTLVSGIITAGIFIALYYLLLVQAVGMTFGNGLFENPLVSGAVAYLTYAALWICPFICPAIAFYFRETIFEVTPSLAGRALIFVAISASPVVFTLAGYGGLVIHVSSKEKHDRRVAEERQAFVDRLKSAGIAVVASNASVVRESEKFAVARVTFQVRNVPDYLSEYNLGLFRGVNEKGLRYKPDDPRNTDDYEFISWINARNEDGTWVFRKYASGEEISRDPENVTFDIQVAGWRSSYLQLSTTITPIVSIWPDLEGSPYKDHPVWREAIPITIRRAPSATD